MLYIPRALERKFLELNSLFRILMVSGARQAGKTTMLRHLAEAADRTYASLDDIAARELAVQDPALFFQTHRPPILIDEVQYAPQLFAYMKMMADASEEPGHFWLRYSQYYSAIRHARESLAGRIGLLEMLTLSQAELIRSDDFNPPDSRLAAGRRVSGGGPRRTHLRCSTVSGAAACPVSRKRIQRPAVRSSIRTSAAICSATSPC